MNLVCGAHMKSPASRTNKTKTTMQMT